MFEVLGLEHLGVTSDGPTLTMSVSRGQTLSIVGPSGSGKSRLLRVLSGIEKPLQGAVRRYGSVASACDTRLSRRQRVQTLAKKSGPTGANPSKAVEVLIATRLWDVRQSLIGDLTPGQVAACELIEPLSGGAGLVFIDGQLDRLDPWVLQSTLQLISQLRSEGIAFVVSTNRADLIASFDALIALKSNQVRFAGTVGDLLRIGPPHRLQVKTENRPGVQALISPFEVSVEETSDGVRIEAAEGQSLAARLLLEGYGDVQFIVVRPPTVSEALLSLFA